MIQIQIENIEFIELIKRSQEVVIVFRHNEAEYSLSIDLNKFERFAQNAEILKVEVKPSNPWVNPHAHAVEKSITVEELYKEHYQDFVYAVSMYLKTEFEQGKKDSTIAGDLYKPPVPPKFPADRISKFGYAQ